MDFSARHYQIKCQKDREAVEALMPKIIEAAEKASFGSIGDIKYTTRTTVPNGGVWCDGAKYAKDDLADVYKMLTEGKLLSVDMATFDNVVSLNGSCGFFGLDDTGFKVPLLKDVYLKAGQEADEFGAESLPNIKGNFRTAEFGWDPTGVFKRETTEATCPTQGSGKGLDWINFNASRSSSAYQDNAKVNPDHVKYRAYVVLYTAEKEVSIVDWTNQLEQKTSNGLSQIQNKTDSGLLQIQNKTDEGVEALTNLGGPPVGTVLPFGGSAAPSGYLLCNGATVSRTTYADLFAVIGTTYGAGNGSTTFALPNYSNARMVTSATVSVKGNGKGMGFYNGSSTAGLMMASVSGAQGTLLARPNYYGLNAGASGSGNTSLGDNIAIGLTNDASKSGITGTASLASTCRFIIKY